MIGSHSQASHPNSGLYYYRNKTRLLEVDLERARRAAEPPTPPHAGALARVDELERLLAQRDHELNAAHGEVDALRGEFGALALGWANQMRTLPFRLADRYTRTPRAVRAVIKLLMIHLLAVYYAGVFVRRLARGTGR